jgi:hypothetical protein
MYSQVGDFHAVFSPSVCITKSLFLLSFKGVAAGTANDGYLLIPGGPGATEIFRYIIEFSTLWLFHGTTTLHLIFYKNLH